MPALDFPPGTTGATYTGPGGVIWVYDGAKWVSGTLTTGIYAPITNDVGRNLIHNSMFNIAQRGAGPFTVAGFCLDRWTQTPTNDTISVTPAALADADRAAIGDEAARQCLSNTFTGSATAGSQNNISHRIEDVSRLGGKTVTVSFWARSPTGLKVGLSIDQRFGSGGSPSAGVNGNGVAFTLTTTWTRYTQTFTLASIAGKTLGTANDHSTSLVFWYSGDNAAWGTRTGNIGVQSGTIAIWGVQLEIGPTATPLEKLDPVLQLQQCQRFYCTGQVRFAGYQGPVAVFYLQTYPTPMRTGPQVAGAYTTQTNCTGSIAAWGAQEISISATVATLGSFVLVGTYTASADL